MYAAQRRLRAGHEVDQLANEQLRKERELNKMTKPFPYRSVTTNPLVG